jgi:hypothetical protein
MIFALQLPMTVASAELINDRWECWHSGGKLICVDKSRAEFKSPTYECVEIGGLWFCEPADVWATNEDARQLEEDLNANPGEIPPEPVLGCYVDGTGEESMPNFNDQDTCEMAHGWWGVPDPDWRPETGTYVPPPIVGTYVEYDCTMWFSARVMKAPDGPTTLHVEYMDGAEDYFAIPAGTGEYSVYVQRMVTVPESIQHATVLEKNVSGHSRIVHDV